MEIKKLNLKDYEQIKNLSKRNGLPFLKENDWKNIWEKNPFILEQQKDWIIGWKLLDQNDQIVGAIHNIPFIFYFDNNKFLAAICGNWVVDNRYKSFSLGLRSKFLNQDNIQLYITNTANEISEKVMEAFKAKKILQYEYINRKIFLLNKKKTIINYIKKISLNKNLILDIKSLIDIMFNRKNLNITKKFSIANDFNLDFDLLNSDLRKKKTLYSIKNKKWLDWKYSRVINTDRLWVIKNYNGNKLVGFLAFVINNEQNYKLKKSTITEFSFLDENNFENFEMIKKCILISKEFNCDVVDVIGFNKFKKNIFKEIGFTDKKMSNFSFLVKNLSPEIEDVLFNSQNNLDMSLTDGDAIFSL